jgi:hypothetical protein
MTLAERCDAIEECYEFMLAYAAQGLPADTGSQVRDYLERAVRALVDITEACTREDIARAFTDVLERDAASSRAALELVLAQPKISSQLIDNLNASIHLRALLTDFFLLDEILKLRGII